MTVRSLCRRKAGCISVGRKKYRLPSICAYLYELAKVFQQAKRLQQTRKSEERIGFRGHADADQGVVGFVVDFCFPVVDLVLLGYRQITLNTALGIEELDLGTALDEAICDFQLRFKLPSLYTLLLNCQELRKRNVCLD